VFEDRAAQSGRTIDLKIVVLPALGNDPQPDPVFFLAGGPGQGAAQMAPTVGRMFRRVQEARDVVLVDQRGTGESNPLDCRDSGDSLAALDEPRARVLARLKDCLASLDADPRLYTTPIAVDDLDEVRRYLGYERINLYGGSYGTRAALVYLSRHEPAVRAVVLDGVAPTDMRLPLFFARDAQRAFDRLVADCAADPLCAQKYPRLDERFRVLMERLDDSPVRTTLVHPRTGVAEEVTVTGEFVAAAVFGALYSPLTSSVLPELIARAERGDFQGLLALSSLSASGSENMSVGMQLSVICSEDYPRITPSQIKEAYRGTAFAGRLLSGRLEACAFWPRGQVDPSYYEPVRSAVPVLVLSGELDPVTPPHWGDSVLPHLSNARHVVVPATGHNAIATGCGMHLVEEFIERGSAEGLDTHCTQSIERPPFFVTPAGPDPSGHRDEKARAASGELR
jgi:pimeloyl-ACP methyl ester carboxylesterase